MQKYSSANTSINKTKLPILFTKVDKHYEWVQDMIVFDLGSGKYLEKIMQFFIEKSINYYPYDPFHYTEGENDKIIHDVISKGGADVCTISNVLNTINIIPVRHVLLLQAHSVLKKNGVCYITCYNSGKPGVSNPDCYQVAKPLRYYLPLVKKVFSNGIIKYNMIKTVKEK